MERSPEECLNNARDTFHRKLLTFNLASLLSGRGCRKETSSAVWIEVPSQGPFHNQYRVGYIAQANATMEKWERNAVTAYPCLGQTALFSSVSWMQRFLREFGQLIKTSYLVYLLRLTPKSPSNWVWWKSYNSHSCLPPALLTLRITQTVTVHSWTNRIMSHSLRL